MIQAHRSLFTFGIVLLLVACGLIFEHDIDAARKSEIIEDYGKKNARVNAQSEMIASRNMNVPNARHVWWAADLFTKWNSSNHLGMTSFGMHYLQVRGNWTALCAMDSNGDGISNGEHLGDPCCRWRYSEPYFDLQTQREYRRWHLTHPSESREESLKNRKKTSMLHDKPTYCNEAYHVDAYKEQLSRFYYHKADDAHEAVGYNIFKIACLLVMLAIIANWLIWKELLTDVLPWTTSSVALPCRLRIAVCIVSFLYMDLTSGVIHLVLDYAPFHLPGIGILARGFQYHHDDPTAIIRISWFEYVSHIHLLAPLIQVAVILSDASRLQRLFWLWGGVWAHLFQTAHRWAHMPPEGLPFIVRALQNAGLLLNNNQHMSHHEDLESQFTILSGHTDVILDFLSYIVPPARYDLWFVFGVFWFLVPIFIDATFRDTVHKLQGTDARNKLKKVELALDL